MRTQRVLTHSLTIAATLFMVNALGFMTEFYVLFIDGTGDMFTFYKDLQSFNNLIFGWGLAALIASLVPLLFDLHKRIAGMFGTGFALCYAVAALIVLLVFRSAALPYIDTYTQFDFSGIEGYQASLAPFRRVYLLFGLLAATAVGLASVVTLNFVRSRNQETHS